MSESRELASFFQESLELVATWLFNESVVLNSIATAANKGSESDSLELFLEEIRSRHALACAILLPDIIKRIELRTSTRPKIKHVVHKDLSRGRLDIDRFVQNRPSYGYRKGKYPILESYYTVQTPENVLVTKVLSQLVVQLGSTPFIKNSIEGKTSAKYYAWIKGKLKRWPWDSVQTYGDVQWLRVQTEQRLLRRRTGNETAYGDFLKWLEEWQLDPAKLHGVPGERFTKGFLAFPVEDFFWERVLEIWCLKITAEALIRLGFKKTAGPLSLQQRKSKALYKFEKEGEVLSIWFQKQQPIGIPRWRYQSGALLVGIPDISIHSTNRGPFIIDAKHKLIDSHTRSEETYKMLGYLENFRSNYDSNKFHCVLLMSSKKLIHNRLYSDRQDEITLIGVTENSNDRESIEACLDHALNSWLK